MTEKAIANSTELKQSKSRIALIEQRLAVTEDRIDYTSKKKWTNYISTDPVNIIQNVVGFFKDLGMKQQQAEDYCDDNDNLIELAQYISSILG